MALSSGGLSSSSVGILAPSSPSSGGKFSSSSSSNSPSTNGSELLETLRRLSQVLIDLNVSDCP